MEQTHATRKPVLIPCSLVFLLLLVLGTPLGAVEGTPRPGGTLRVAFPAEPPTLDTQWTTTAVTHYIMVASADPVGSGLVASLARPGGNLTGLSALAPEVGGKRLQLLREALPGVFRVAVLWNPADPAKAPDPRSHHSPDTPLPGRRGDPMSRDG
jgi:hypothetical protein